MNLDEMLDQARPAVAPRTDELHEELAYLVRSTRPAVSRPGRRVAAVVGVATGLLGAGVVGAAAGVVPWPTWWADSPTGATCEVTYQVNPHHASGGHILSRPISEAEQDRVATAARRILARMDFDAIDLDAAIRIWREEEARVRTDQTADERQPVMVGDDLTRTAMYYVVTQKVSAELRAQGLDPEAVTFSAGSRCE